MRINIYVLRIQFTSRCLAVILLSFMFMSTGCCFINGMKSRTVNRELGSKKCSCSPNETVAKNKIEETQPFNTADLALQKKITTKSASSLTEISENPIQKEENPEGMSTELKVPDSLNGTQYLSNSITEKEPVLYTSETHVIDYSSPKAEKNNIRIKPKSSHVSAGPTLTSGKVENGSPKIKSGAGFQFGVGSDYIIGKNFRMRTSLNFSQKKFTNSTGGGSYMSDTKYTYNYLSAPVQATFSLAPKIHLAIGPEFNYLLSATSQYNYNNGGGTGNGEKTKITDRSTRLGMGLQGDVTWQFSKNLKLQGGVDKSISRVNKKSDDTYLPNSGSWASFWISILFFDDCF